MSSDSAVIIPVNERKKELEKQVQYYLSLAGDEIKTNVMHRRSKLENFKDPVEQIMWEKEEIRRCKYGHNGMSGKMYFYFHYGNIMNLSGGKIHPDFRVADQKWFNELTDAQQSREWGIVCAKRRRVGMSWKESADVLHDVLFNTYYKVGMNSKSERDSIELFKKVKFMYDNLPSFLRVRTTASNTKMYMDFSYYVRDDNGNRIKKGNNSDITVVSPTPSAFEGMMLNKWVCDEAGKIEHLPSMWSYTIECLMEETERVGIPIIFGTSGEVGREGAGLMNMWKNSDIYRLRRFFFAGWNGLVTDMYGNDMVEDAIRWIVYERDRLKGLSAKEYNDFLQKYPLTVDEAFSIASAGGVGNIININKQLSNLRESPVKKVEGKFKLDTGGEIIWTPQRGAKGIMYENRIIDTKNLYNAGADPADHDDAYNEASDLSLVIRRKQIGTKPPQIVFTYTDRPQKVKDFYNQALLALLYYNKTKVLIERNRYNMISYFDDMGYKYLLSTTPQGITKMVNGRLNVIGIHMNEAVKEYMEGLITEEIDEYYEYIPSEKLLMECIEYGSKNTDLLMAWGICLIQAKEDRIKVKRSNEISNKLRMSTYKRLNSGVIVRN